MLGPVLYCAWGTGTSHGVSQDFGKGGQIGDMRYDIHFSFKTFERHGCLVSASWPSALSCNLCNHAPLTV